MMLIRTLLCRACIVVVLLDQLMMAPEMLVKFSVLVLLKVLHFMHLKTACMAASSAVVLMFWWNNGPPPERSPCIPKHHHHWRRLPKQFCQLLKS